MLRTITCDRLSQTWRIVTRYVTSRAWRTITRYVSSHVTLCHMWRSNTSFFDGNKGLFCHSHTFCYSDLSYQQCIRCNGIHCTLIPSLNINVRSDRYNPEYRCTPVQWRKRGFLCVLGCYVSPMVFRRSTSLFCCVRVRVLCSLMFCVFVYEWAFECSCITVFARHSHAQCVPCDVFKNILIFVCWYGCTISTVVLYCVHYE